MSVSSLSHVSPVRTRVPWAWVAFGVLVVAAWAAVVAHHVQAHSMHDATLGTLLVMWALMTVAMMAPSAVPVLRSLRDVTAGRADGVWWAFLGAYLGVWLVASSAAAVAQWLLTRLDVVSHHGALTSRWAVVGVLAIAGVYQFSALKARCQTQCASPMTFFWKHWRDGTSGGARMGVRHGLTCFGCCWALMLLAFAGGLSNLWLMVVCAVAMAVEKLPRHGQRITAPLGVALLVASGVVAVGGFVHADHADPAHRHTAPAVHINSNRFD